MYNFEDLHFSYLVYLKCFSINLEAENDNRKRVYP